MKKISLLFLMLLAFTVSSTAQSLPKPANPVITSFIDYGAMIDLGYEIPEDFDGNLVGDDYTIEKYFTGQEYSILDPEKVSFSIFTDNDILFTFTPELFPLQVTEPLTQFPYSSRIPNGDVGYWDIHFDGLTTIAQDGVEPFFTWRIGLQSYYTDNGETTSSDIVYMEIYPQLKPAAEVTSTSFLADWICNEENTFIINNFYGEGCGYFLYVIDKATQEVVLTQNVAPTNYAFDEWGNEYPLPGAAYQVEGLTPGATYEFYVVVVQNTGMSYQSVVQEVTLPQTVYILGEVNAQGWAPNAGTLMEYDAENNVYTAAVTCDGRNDGFNYFSFTTRVAEDNDQGGWDYIAPYRFGAVSEGDFLVTDEMLGIELSMEASGDAYKIPAGEYNLTVDYDNMTLKIEKIMPDVNIGDVNKDGEVNIADVTTLIDHLLSNDFEEGEHFSPLNANVNGDEDINISDVTALIDRLLGL